MDLSLCEFRYLLYMLKASYETFELICTYDDEGAELLLELPFLLWLAEVEWVLRAIQAVAVLDHEFSYLGSSADPVVNAHLCDVCVVEVEGELASLLDSHGVGLPNALL